MQYLILIRLCFMLLSMLLMLSILHFTKVMSQVVTYKRESCTSQGSSNCADAKKKWLYELMVWL